MAGQKGENSGTGTDNGRTERPEDRDRNRQWPDRRQKKQAGIGTDNGRTERPEGRDRNRQWPDRKARRQR